MSSSDSDWEKAFWLIFERSANPIGLLDERRRYVDVNPAAARLFGLDRSEIIGTSALDYIPPAERPRWERDWEAVLRNEQEFGTGPVIRADGSEGEVEVAARPLEIGGRQLVLHVLLAPVPSEGPTEVSPHDRMLTVREREIVTEIALGAETETIAQRMFISPSTVRTHVRNAMAKLGAHTRAQLVAIALSSGQCSYPPHPAGVAPGTPDAAARRLSER